MAVIKKIKFLDLYQQSLPIKNQIRKKINSCIRESNFINGKEVNLFQNSFKLYLGVKHCLGVANGTDALEIAIRSLNLKKNSEIIVPANSWISSAEAVLTNNFKLKFVDVDETCNICIKDLKKKISKQTSAIIVVHLFGNPANILSISRYCKQYNIKIIEDCAQAHGAAIQNKKISTIGDVATFSFFPSKNLGCFGDGGAIVTNKKKIFLTCKKIANHGGLKKNKNEIVGRNSRLDNIQAAILNIKLKKLDKWIKIRDKQANLYKSELKNVGDLTFVEKLKNTRSSNYVFIIKSSKRDQLRAFLEKKKIETHIHYPKSLPELKVFKKKYFKSCSKMSAVSLSKQILSLPIGEHLSINKIKYICSKIKLFYND